MSPQRVGNSAMTSELKFPNDCERQCCGSLACVPENGDPARLKRNSCSPAGNINQSTTLFAVPTCDHECIELGGAVMTRLVLHYLNTITASHLPPFLPHSIPFSDPTP